MRIKPNVAVSNSLIWQRDFRNMKVVADGGGVATGTPTFDGIGMYCDGSSGVDYTEDLTKFFTEGGSIRVKWRRPAGSNSVACRVFAYTLGTAYAISVSNRQDTGTIYIQVEYGTGAYYWVVSTIGGAKNDFVFTWNPGTTTLKAYYNGVYQGERTTSSGSSYLTKDTTTDKIRCGTSSTSPLVDGYIDLAQWYNKVLNVEEILDLYQNDTFQEVDRPQVYLPLKSQYRKETGANLLADYDMEATGIGNWTLSAYASVEKIAGSRPGGVGGQIMRVAQTGGTSAYAWQASRMTVGNSYRITGWARSDGTNAPRLGDGTTGSNIWTGTSTHTNWQYFDVIHVAASTATLLTSAVVVGGYSEFDDITVQLYSPQTDNIMVQKGQLLADGNMDKAGTDDFSSYQNAVLTKETGITGQCLRITYGGTNNPGALQNVLTANRRYRVTGYARGDGTGIPRISDGSTKWSGVASNSWQRFDVFFTAQSASLLLISTLAVAGYVEFAEVSATEESGCISGDGYTTTTFPTQLAGGGFSFDGGDYIQSGVVPSATGSLACMFEGAVTEKIFIGSQLTSSKRCYLGGNASKLAGGIGNQNWVTIVDSLPVTMTSGLHTGILTWDGTTVNLYRDGISVYSGAQDGEVTNGRQLYVGAHNYEGTGAAYFQTGNIYDARIYNIALTPMQAKYLHQKMLNTKNT